MRGTGRARRPIGDDRIDRLSRIVAVEMPRRQALRLGAGAVLAGTVFSGLVPKRALAATCDEVCNCTGGQVCCCIPSSVTPGAVVYGGCYYPEVSECCTVNRADGSKSVVLCDNDTEYCDPDDITDYCKCYTPCGNLCCPTGQSCKAGRCVPCDGEPCGELCCERGRETCIGDECRPCAVPCKQKCCIPGEETCCNGKCCDKGRCCGDSRCCDKNETCCKSKVGPKTIGLCCGKNETCCKKGDKAQCCSANQRCSKNGCEKKPKGRKRRP